MTENGGERKLKYKNIIFDFDGTLCDTSEGVINCVFYAAKALNIKYDETNINTDKFIGPPLLFTFEKYFNADPSTAEALVRKYRERYDGSGLYESKLYPGIEKLLKKLKADGFSVGISSSKPTKYILKLTEKFGINKYFDSICGVSFQNDTESKSDIVMRTVEELGGEKEKSLVIGDTHYDIEAATSKGIDSCAVEWGFEDAKDLIGCGAKFIARKAEDIYSIAVGLFEKPVSKDLIYCGKIIDLYKNEVELCDGRTAKREIVKHNGGVGIVAVNNANEVILVRQFRAGPGEVTVEIPAGKLEAGENPEEAAKRELSEECGAAAGEFYKIAEIYPTPAYCTEIIRIYYAANLKFSSAHLDKGEFLELTTVPFDKAVAMCLDNEIKDSKTIIGILKAREIIEDKQNTMKNAKGN